MGTCLPLPSLPFKLMVMAGVQRAVTQVVTLGSKYYTILLRGCVALKIGEFIDARIACN